MNQEEEYEDDYEDDEYEDDFDEFEGDAESPNSSSKSHINSAEHLNVFDSSHSVLQGTKSSPRKQGMNTSDQPHSAWYGGHVADNTHPDGVEDCSSSSESVDDGACCVAPMPISNNYKAPSPTVVDSGHFTSKPKHDIQTNVWSSERVPMTAESARGSAALLPYHTQLIRRDHWKLGKKIGAGTFGVVHQGLNEDTGMAVAVKVMKRVGRDEAAIKELENEITLMQRLDHPNIVRYLGCQVDSDSCYIFCEWVPCGSLADMIKNYGPLKEPVLKRYLRQILFGLEYLHERFIVHRDLKGGNVLVNEFGEAKLADFGCSKTMSADGTLGEVAHGSIKGTPYFMSPEVIKNERAGRPSDIWSLGGVVFQMATGDPPWKSHNFKTPVVLFYHVVNAQEPPPLSGVSKGLIKLVNSCFARDPASRPTARDMLDDNYFSDMETKPAQTSSKELEPLSETSKELADIFTPTIDRRQASNKETHPFPSPPASELSSPEPVEQSAESPATNSGSIGTNIYDREQPIFVTRKAAQENEVLKPKTSKVIRKKKVERKWGVNGYQKPSTAPDGPKNRQASVQEMRPITAPDHSTESSLNAQPRQKSSLSKFKKRFQDPARISMHELQVTQHTSQTNTSKP